MTPQETIAELEKPRKGYSQGVLTWEAGDVAMGGKGKYLVRNAFNDDIGKRRLILENHPDNDIPYAVHFTHNADDPRLLGRAMKALEKDVARFKIQYYWGGCEISCFPKERKYDDSKKVIGDTLLHAALLAWLAKVEGEQA